MLLTTVEVAERLGLSSAAVAQAVRNGALQPTARTNDDLLFTERAVADFAERRAAAVTSPLEAPAPGSRAEWSGDVDRLNAWLKDLTEALPPAAEQSPPPAMVVTRVVEPQAIDFRPPPPAAPPPPPAVEAEPESKPDPAPAAPAAGRSLFERIQALEAAIAAPPAVEPAPVVEAPEPLPVALAKEPAPGVEAPRPTPVAPELEPEPEPEPVPVPVAEAASPGLELSRQALLVVQPVVRFRVLREVAGRLGSLPGIADARLERLEGGVASYRVSFEGERPSGDAIGSVLADLNLEVILVDSFL